MTVGRRRTRTANTWYEQDLYTRWRQYLNWQRGQRRWVKRQTHKRERRDAKRDIAEDRRQS